MNNHKKHILALTAGLLLSGGMINILAMGEDEYSATKIRLEDLPGAEGKRSWADFVRALGKHLPQDDAVNIRNILWVAVYQPTTRQTFQQLFKQTRDKLNSIIKNRPGLISTQGVNEISNALDKLEALTK